VVGINITEENDLSLETISKVWKSYNRTNRRTMIDSYNLANARVSGGMGGMSAKEAVCLGCATLDAAKSSRDSLNTIHLIIGSYSLGSAFYLYNVLRDTNINNQRIIVRAPKDISSYIAGEKSALGITNDDMIIISDDSNSRLTQYLDRMKIASVYVYDYNLIFNWEEYNAYINRGGHITFSDTDSIHTDPFEQIPDWEVLGSYSRFLFLRRKKENENRMHDTNQST